MKATRDLITMSLTAHITTPPPMVTPHFTFPPSTHNTPNGGGASTTMLSHPSSNANVNESNDYFSVKINNTSSNSNLGSFLTNPNNSTLLNGSGCEEVSTTGGMFDAVGFFNSSKYHSSSKLANFNINLNQNSNTLNAVAATGNANSSSQNLNLSSQGRFKNKFQSQLSNNDKLDSNLKSNIKNLKLNLNADPTTNNSASTHNLLTPVSAIDTTTFQLSAIDITSRENATRATEQSKPPVLTKHSTYSSLPISNYFSYDKSKINKKSFPDIQFPPSVKQLSSSQAANYISCITRDESSHLPNFLVVDIRPFTEYVKSHITGSLHFAIPTTLLRRPKFKLDQCISSLSQQEKLIFKNYCSRSTSYPSIVVNEQQDEDQDMSYVNCGIPCGPTGLPAVLLYDNSSSLKDLRSASLGYMARKFVEENAWDAPVYVLEGGFTKFVAEYGDFTSDIKTGISDSLNCLTDLNLDDTCNNDNNEKNNDNEIKGVKRKNVLNLSLAGGYHNKAASLSSMTIVGNDSPVLSKFILPEQKSVFKIRHNEEVFNNDLRGSTISLNTSYNDLTGYEQSKLPSWILKIFKNDNDKESKLLIDKFNELELKEKRRLDAALSSQKAFAFTTIKEDSDDNLSQTLSPLVPEIPSISGVELGSKNRYPDIIVYEHSRVRLFEKAGRIEQHERDEKASEMNYNKNPSSDCDYINASYINVSGSNNKYIATQGPLPNTIGDFWRIVVNHRSPIIFSLTAENEGGVVKCAPYWKPGTYFSNETKIEVSLVESDEKVNVNQNTSKDENGYCSDFVIRRLKVSIDDGKIVHEVLQMHISSWPDLGTFVEPDDLLNLIFLKRFVKSHYDTFSRGNSPIIVHCSAGCGRTGTLCAIDSVIDLMLKNDMGIDKGENYDPILTTVDIFRKQRISMVQNLRQYLLIYDTVLLFLRLKINGKLEWIEDIHLPIVNHFLSDQKSIENI